MNVQDEFYHPVATPVQTGIREGYQAKKGDNQRYSIGIMVLFMEIYWGYMQYFLANTLITLELLREPCFRAVIVTAKHAFVCQ